MTLPTNDEQPADLAQPPWVSRRIETFEQAIMIAAMLLLLFAVSWGVLSRYVVAVPAAWITEVTNICFAWLIFVGSAEVHRRRMHIGVDMLTSFLPIKAQGILAIMMEILVAAFCIYASNLAIQQTITSHSSHTSILRLPLSFGYAGLSLGLIMMSFRSLRYLLVQFRKLIGR